MSVTTSVNMQFYLRSCANYIGHAIDFAYDKADRSWNCFPLTSPGLLAGQGRTTLEAYQSFLLNNNLTDPEIRTNKVPA